MVFSSHHPIFFIKLQATQGTTTKVDTRRKIKSQYTSFARQALAAGHKNDTPTAAVTGCINQ